MPLLPATYSHHRHKPERSLIARACAYLPCCGPRQAEMGHSSYRYKSVPTTPPESVKKLPPELALFKDTAEFVDIAPPEAPTFRYLSKYILLAIIVSLGTAYLPLAGFNIAGTAQAIFNLSDAVVFFLSVLFSITVFCANGAINLTSTEKGIIAFKKKGTKIKDLYREKKYGELTTTIAVTTLKVTLAAVGSLATWQFAGDVALRYSFLTPLPMRRSLQALCTLFDFLQKFRTLEFFSWVNAMEVEERYELLLLLNEMIRKITSNRALSPKEIQGLAHGQLEMRSEALNVLMTLVAASATSVYVFGARLKSTETTLQKLFGLGLQDYGLYVTMPAYIGTFLQWAFLTRPLKWYFMTLLKKWGAICDPQRQRRFPKIPASELAIWWSIGILSIPSCAGAAWTMYFYSDIIRNASSDPRLRFLYTWLITLGAAYMINITDWSNQTIRCFRWFKCISARKDSIVQNRLIYSGSGVGDEAMVNYLLKVMLALSVKQLEVEQEPPTPLSAARTAAPIHSSFWAKLFATLGLCRLPLLDTETVLAPFRSPISPQQTLENGGQNVAANGDLNVGVRGGTSLTPSVSGASLDTMDGPEDGDRAENDIDNSPPTPGSADTDSSTSEEEEEVSHSETTASDLEAGPGCCPRLFRKKATMAPMLTANEKQTAFENNVIKLFKEAGCNRQNFSPRISKKESSSAQVMDASALRLERFFQAALSP